MAVWLVTMIDSEQVASTWWSGCAHRPTVVVAWQRPRTLAASNWRETKRAQNVTICRPNYQMNTVSLPSRQTQEKTLVCRHFTQK